VQQGVGRVDQLHAHALQGLQKGVDREREGWGEKVGWWRWARRRGCGAACTLLVCLL
jgi:hypothetical protein